MTRSQSQEFLATVAEHGRLLSVDQALAIGEEAGLNAAAVRTTLHRLNRDRWLRRIRRGLYLVAPPGAAPLHPFVIATALDENAAVSGWAALHYYNLTEQIPRVTEVTSTHRLRDLASEEGRRILTFEGERFEIVRVVQSRFFGIDDLWLDNERARIFDRERAVLDLFIRPREFGGLEVALDLLESHLTKIRVDRLVEHALTLDATSVAKRVGWCLEKLGVKERGLRPLLELRATSYSLLDPSRPAGGVRQARWHLRENLEVKA